MGNIDEVNKRISKLSDEEIEGLSEEEILNLAMERPGHPGQYGFLLSPEFFESEEHIANTLHALLQRLGKVDQLEEKMSKKQDQ